MQLRKYNGSFIERDSFAQWLAQGRPTVKANIVINDSLIHSASHSFSSRWNPNLWTELLGASRRGSCLSFPQWLGGIICILRGCSNLSAIAWTCSELLPTYSTLRPCSKVSFVETSLTFQLVTSSWVSPSTLTPFQGHLSGLHTHLYC